MQMAKTDNSECRPFSDIWSDRKKIKTIDPYHLTSHAWWYALRCHAATHEVLNKDKNRFYTGAGFSRAIGAVDCTRANCQASHVAILDTICPVQCMIGRHGGFFGFFAMLEKAVNAQTAHSNNTLHL